MSGAVALLLCCKPSGCKPSRVICSVSLPSPSTSPYNPPPTAQVGDIDTDMLLWYRPEEAQLPRPAFAVDGTTGAAGWLGPARAPLLLPAAQRFPASSHFAVTLPPSLSPADLGGSVSAALAAASVLFRAQNDTAYAQRLLDKAKEAS